MSLALKFIRSIHKGSFSSTIPFCRAASTGTNVTKILSNAILSGVPLHINNNWIWQKSNPIIEPTFNKTPVNLPNPFLKISLIDPVTNIVIEDPININNDRLETIGIIVIRRKKMKKHKLRKLRKRMKYENAKRRQRRAMKREKAFHALLIGRCKEADVFSAEDYVANKINLSKREPPPRFHDTDLFKELMKRKKLKLPIDDLVTLK